MEQYLLGEGALIQLEWKGNVRLAYVGDKAKNLDRVHKCEGTFSVIHQNILNKIFYESIFYFFYVSFHF